jgi:predicted aspartyl protease
LAKKAAPIPIVALTGKAGGRSNTLLCPAKISHAFQPPATKNNPKEPKEYIAIWDTGATSTVVTKKVVNECGLKPIGMAKVHTAGGENVTSVYLISVFLPNNVVFASLKVTEGKISGDVDILIGMDIIGAGDFAVTNKDGQTMFSFRVPSLEHIDFAKQLKDNRSPNPPPFKASVPKVGRNAPCPCNSGLKYKKCCGK